MDSENLLHEADLSPSELARAMLNRHVGDNVETLNNLEIEQAAPVLAALPVERAVEILTALGSNVASPDQARQALGLAAVG